MRRTTPHLSIYQKPSETQKPEFMRTMGSCVWKLVFPEKNKQTLGYEGYTFCGVCVSPCGLILTVSSVFLSASDPNQDKYNPNVIGGYYFLGDNEYSDVIPLVLLGYDYDRNLALLSPESSPTKPFNYCVISKAPIGVNLPVATTLINGQQYGLATGNVVTTIQKYENIKRDQLSWNEAFRKDIPLKPMDNPVLPPKLTLTEISGFPMVDDFYEHLLGHPVFMYDGRLIGLISVHGLNSCYAVNFKYLEKFLAKSESIREAVNKRIEIV